MVATDWRNDERRLKSAMFATAWRKRERRYEVKHGNYHKLFSYFFMRDDCDGPHLSEMKKWFITLKKNQNKPPSLTRSPGASATSIPHQNCSTPSSTTSADSQSRGISHHIRKQLPINIQSHGGIHIIFAKAGRGGYTQSLARIISFEKKGAQRQQKAPASIVITDQASTNSIIFNGNKEAPTTPQHNASVRRGDFACNEKNGSLWDDLI
jgi:hypothetical protein